MKHSLCIILSINKRFTQSKAFNVTFIDDPNDQLIILILLTAVH
jgi:hypothetical protein